VTGATPVRVALPPPAFRLDAASVEAAITPRTRAVIVNSPHNPTGRILTTRELEELGKALARASARHGRPILLLSDESYCRILFDGRSFVSPAAFYPHTIVLYTYGKQLLAPGERVGYLALSPSIRDRAALNDTIRFAQIVGGWQFPNTTLQRAVPDLENLIIDIPALERRRDRMAQALGRLGYEVMVPEATFYMMVRSPMADDGAFASRLARHDVFVGPGHIFEMPGYFRISLTANDDMVSRSLAGFAAAIYPRRAHVLTYPRLPEPPLETAASMRADFNLAPIGLVRSRPDAVDPGRGGLRGRQPSKSALLPARFRPAPIAALRVAALRQHTSSPG
jgi:aspartate aminotransferase